MGPVEHSIREKLQRAFSPLELDVENESYRHAVPKGSESHFRALIVSEIFEDQARLRRHQQVYSVLAEEMKSGVHALAIEALTLAEWTQGNRSVRKTPDCQGGSKTDQ